MGMQIDGVCLTGAAGWRMILLLDGCALVSTWEMRQRLHAEDGSLASLKIEPNQTANQELALAA